MIAGVQPVLAEGFFGNLFLALIPLGILAMWVFALVDLFWRRSHSGVGTAIWLVVIILLPILGPLAYVASTPGWEGKGARDMVPGEQMHTPRPT